MLQWQVLQVELLLDWSLSFGFLALTLGAVARPVEMYLMRDRFFRLFLTKIILRITGFAFLKIPSCHWCGLWRFKFRKLDCDLTMDLSYQRFGNLIYMTVRWIHIDRLFQVVDRTWKAGNISIKRVTNSRAITTPNEIV
jgi:hypothetical protein